MSASLRHPAGTESVPDSKYLSVGFAPDTQHLPESAAAPNQNLESSSPDAQTLGDEIKTTQVKNTTDFISQTPQIDP